MSGTEFLILLVVVLIGYGVMYLAGYEDGYRRADREARKEWMDRASGR